LKSSEQLTTGGIGESIRDQQFNSPGQEKESEEKKSFPLIPLGLIGAGLVTGMSPLAFIGAGLLLINRKPESASENLTIRFENGDVSTSPIRVNNDFR
jgi:hypothetical protein